jgi:pyrimidine and pyridine-specific 5'-nucleotidase
MKKSVPILMFPRLLTVQQLSVMLSSISTLHSRKITNYKRLLERTQLSSAAQLHALQAEVYVLKQKLQSQPNNQVNGNGDALGESSDALCAKCGGKRTGRGGYWSGFRGFEDEDSGEETEHDLALVLRGKNDFDEKEVRKAVRGLKREARGRLLVFRCLVALLSKNYLQDWNYSGM